MKACQDPSARFQSRGCDGGIPWHGRSLFSERVILSCSWLFAELLGSLASIRHYPKYLFQRKTTSTRNLRFGTCNIRTKPLKMIDLVVRFLSAEHQLHGYILNNKILEIIIYIERKWRNWKLFWKLLCCLTERHE